MAHSSSTLTPNPCIDFQAAIVALASPSGPGARAILRLTGVDLFSLLTSSGFNLITPFAQHRSTLSVTLPRFSTPIPTEVLCWRGPATYTGQDLVELHLPGSPPLVQAVLEHLLASGFRL